MKPTLSPFFLNDWKKPTPEESIDALAEDFKLRPKDLRGVTILLASYTYECYEGEAFVLFEKNGKLYEVYGSHCSCYGLEDQWKPAKISAEELRTRLNDAPSFGLTGYSDGRSVYRNELSAIVDALTHQEIGKAA